MQNTTATANRKPSQDPTDLVTTKPYSDSMDLAGWTGTCQAITGSGNACSHQAAARKRAAGPRLSTTILLCKAHARSQYAITADPSL